MDGVPCVYVVDNKKLIPHLSLFHINTSSGNINELTGRVKEVISKYKPIKIRSIEFRKSPNSSSLWFRLSGKRNLKKLHEEMVISCNDLRTGEMPWNPKRKPTRQEKENRKKYGVQHVFQRFNPHLTMAKLTDGRHAKKIILEMKNVKFSFLVNEIAITEVNNWLQVTKIIKRFRLK